jgi:hypothetical protein
VTFTPLLLYPRGKSPPYPLDRRLGGPQSRSGRRGEDKIIDPTGTRTPTPLLSIQLLVAIPTALSRLLTATHAKRKIHVSRKVQNLPPVVNLPHFRSIKLDVRQVRNKEHVAIPVTGHGGP